MSLIVYAPFMHPVFLTAAINGKYIGLAIPIIPIMVNLNYAFCACFDVTFLQIAVEELRKAIVRAFPACIKQVVAMGEYKLVPNPHPFAIIAKLTQY
jgi:hypothetical protein